LILWSTGTITVEMVRTAKRTKNIVLPKKLNQSTGKISNRQTGFNDVSWGDSTRAYAQSIKASLSDKSFDKILQGGIAFARKSRRAKDISTGDTGTQAIVLDKRAQLKDRPCSDDEEYDGADEKENA
jgi:hypothetical protein